MNTAPCISGMDACAGVSVTFYWPSPDLHITLKSGIAPVRHNRDLFSLALSAFVRQARPDYQKSKSANARMPFSSHLQHTRAHTPARIRIQMAAMNLHCIYRCGKRPFYKWLLMMPLHCKRSDYAEEIFRERERAQGHSTRVWILRKPPKVPTGPWFIRPFPAYVCYDVISAGLNQIEGNPKHSDQCWERQ